VGRHFFWYYFRLIFLCVLDYAAHFHKSIKCIWRGDAHDTHLHHCSTQHDHGGSGTYCLWLFTGSIPSNLHTDESLNFLVSALRTLGPKLMVLSTTRNSTTTSLSLLKIHLIRSGKETSSKLGMCKFF